MEWKKHLYRVGSNEWADDTFPADPQEQQTFEKQCRKHIEPWLSAVFQSEHLSLLLGSGFTTGIGYVAGSTATGMGTITFGTRFDAQIDAHAKASAKIANRGEANIEDQLRSALALLEGIESNAIGCRRQNIARCPQLEIKRILFVPARDRTRDCRIWERRQTNDRRAILGLIPHEFCKQGRLARTVEHLHDEL